MLVPISLVITVYNRERYLGAAIESVLAQTRGDWELVVWDDGSTDRSVEIAQNYAREDARVRVVAAQHQGRGRALKDAIAQTTGNYIGFVDSDDILAPTALEETAAVLDAHPATGLVYTDYLVMNESGEVTGYGSRCRVPYSPSGLLRKFMTFHFRLIRRTVFDQVGGINESFYLSEDYELCLRLSEVTQVQRVSKPLYYYRVHRESITQQQKAEQNRLALIAIKQARKRRQRVNSFQVTLPTCTQNLCLAPLLNRSFSEEGWGHLKRLQYSKLPHFTHSLVRSLSSFLLAAVPLLGTVHVTPALAQIVPATDGTNTLVNTTGNQLDITGGQTSSNGANLFHSFSQFDVNTGQTANFQSNPTIQNILGRVVSGNASNINGLIQVSGSQANLYLMNPAGIIFGSNASLNVPASFVATTATSIGIGNNWFNAAGTNDYTQLNDTPNGFAFTTSQPGSIVNSGNLAVGAGKDLMLLGGTVVSTGQLNAPSGKITIAAVPGTSLVRLSQPGSVLSLEVLPPASGSNSPTQWTLPVSSLPQLLTGGGGGGGNATGLSVNATGQAVLTGSDIIIENGDVVAKNVTAQQATLTANHNLTLVDSTLTTTGDLNLLAQDTVRVRDSVTSPFIAQAGGKLLVQGNQNIDIFALNNPASGLFSGGDMVLRSTNTVGGDAHYFSGGNFRIETLDGSLGNLFSPDDPVIRASGDVNFASYTGASLHIFAGGSVTITGNVTITGVDAITYSIAEDVTLSDGTVLAINGSTQPTLDIRAGTTAFGTPGITASFPANVIPGLGTGGTGTSANIAIGSITNPGGVVFLTNQYSPNAALPGGAIQVGGINTSNTVGNGGSVTIDSRSSITLTGKIDASAQATAINGGNVTLIARDDITTALGGQEGGIDTGASAGSPIGSSGNILLVSTAGGINTNGGFLSANTPIGNSGNSGTVSLQAAGNIITTGIFSEALGGGSGGAIAITSLNGTVNTSAERVDSRADSGNGGQIIINAASDITTAWLWSDSSGAGNGASITVNSTAGAIDTTAGFINSSSVGGNGGAIALSAFSNITAGSLDSRSGGSGSKGGDININAGGNFTASNVISIWQGTTTGNGGDITVNAGGDISSQDDFLSFTRNGGGGNITLTAGGNIFADDIYSIGSLSSGDIKLTSGGTIDNSFADGTPGLISSCSGTGNTCSGGSGRGGNITLQAPTRIATAINATGPLGGGNIILTSDEIDPRGTSSNGGTLLLQPFTPSQNIAIAGATDSGTGTLDITTADIAALLNGFSSITIGGANSSGAINIFNPVTFNDPVTIQAPEGAGTINATGAITGLDNASITLKANQNITTSNITANPGITIISSNGTIDTSAGILDSSSTTANGGVISLSALGNIATNNLTSHSDSGAGGDITLNSQTGIINSGNLDASGNTRGGNITVMAKNQITAGQINSSAITGDGGNVFLDPIGDIQVDSINAQGGTSGKGGAVDITTNQFFRAVGSFSDRNGINASISTAGGTGSGDIIIRHDGGARAIPFNVGDATINGTAGAITTGTANSILPLQSFPGAYTQGNIQIITQNPPPPPQPPLTPIPSPPPSPSPKPDTNRVPKDIQGENFVPQGINTISASALVLLNTTDIVRQEIDQAISDGQVEKAIALVEQLRMQEFQNHFEGNLTSDTGESGSVEQTQAVLSDIATNTGKTPAVIYVFTQPDQLQLILVTPKDKPLLKTVYQANRDTLLKMAAKFRSGVTEPRSKTGYQAAAKQLYQWLVEPLEAELQAKKIDTLVFSMDGGLRSIPMAALYDGKQFLVEKYSIGLIPSLNLTDTRYGDVKTTEVLAMGASKFDDQNALPAVPTELSTLVGKQNLAAENRELLPANPSSSQGLWTGKSFLNQGFTLTNLKAQRDQTPFGVIHLATHGEFNLGAPRNSYIQLSDSKLRLDQLRQMGWNNPPVELLVLSACRTALGNEDAEFGFGGLAVAAGVKSAIASLWYVSDEGTLGLITEFYQQLKTAPIKAEALRQAQIAMIKGQVRLEGGQLRGIGQGESIPLPPELAQIDNKEFSHPYYWSAFTMIGSPW